MTADDVTDAMVNAFDAAVEWEPGRVPSLSQMKRAIAAAINASGCVLVPREPTPEMVEAAIRFGGWKPERWREVWTLMLAAADPRQQALDRMAENAQELGLYGKGKGDE